MFKRRKECVGLGSLSMFWPVFTEHACLPTATEAISRNLLAKQSQAPARRTDSPLQAPLYLFLPVEGIAPICPCFIIDLCSCPRPVLIPLSPHPLLPYLLYLKLQDIPQIYLVRYQTHHTHTTPHPKHRPPAQCFHLSSKWGHGGTSVGTS